MSSAPSASPQPGDAGTTVPTFTVRQFVAGAVTACVLFGLLAGLTAGVWALASGGSPVVLFSEVNGVALAVEVAAVACGAAMASALVLGVPAYLLGRALQRVRRTGMHLLIWAAVGIAAGVLVHSVFVLLGVAGTGSALIVPVLLLWAGLSTAAGWWWASRPLRAAGARHP